jgi:hypothetical protein
MLDGRFARKLPASAAFWEFASTAVSRQWPAND